MTTDPPLSASVVAVLRYDATAALAALLVISAAHKQIFEWAARVMTKPKLAKTPAKTAPGAEAEGPRPQRRKAPHLGRRRVSRSSAGGAGPR